MKNKEKWKPSKYIWKRGKLIASGDKKHIGVGSRLIADIVAGYYGQYLPKYAHGRLLDLGCGDVPLFHVYDKYVSDVVCVDWENTSHKNEYLDFTCDLNKELPFCNNEFDTIILSDVLEHIQNPQLLCGNIARILSKDGILLMNVPFYYMLHEMPYDYYRYTEYMLKQFIENEGLELIFLEAVGGILEIWGDMHSKALAQLGVIGISAANIIQKSIRLLRKTKMGVKIYDKTKDRFPLGYFLIARRG